MVYGYCFSVYNPSSILVGTNWVPSLSYWDVVMRVVQLHDFLEPHILDGCLREVRELDLKRYDNPFEHKWLLENKGSIGPNLVNAFQELKQPSTCRWVQRLLDIPLSHANYTRFGGVFVYDVDDYLSPHVDAGEYQDTHKLATALIYLTEAALQTWNGDSCLKEDPQVWAPTTYIIQPNTCVLFENTDTAWHGVPIVHTKARVALTLSYMSHPDFKRTGVFRNPRTHAYFARQVGEGHELDSLRQLRASDQAHKAWRT